MYCKYTLDIKKITFPNHFGSEKKSYLLYFIIRITSGIKRSIITHSMIDHFNVAINTDRQTNKAMFCP